ncbi:MAG: hypothetical protein WBA88_09475 [Pseudaminobacter sp.]
MKSVALLWFALFLAAVHGLAGGSSMLRSALVAADGPATVTSQYAGGGHKTLAQQRNIAIADWQNLRLMPAQAGGDADPAIVPPEIRAVQAERRHVLSASLETLRLSATPHGFSARAPPFIL